MILRRRLRAGIFCAVPPPVSDPLLMPGDVPGSAACSAGFRPSVLRSARRSSGTRSQCPDCGRGDEADHVSRTSQNRLHAGARSSCLAAGHSAVFLLRDRLREALERVAGIEPATYSLGSCRSATELHPQYQRFWTVLQTPCHVECARIRTSPSSKNKGEVPRPARSARMPRCMGPLIRASESVWKVSGPGPDSANRYPRRRASSAVPPCARRRGGRQSGRARE